MTQRDAALPLLPDASLLADRLGAALGGGNVTVLDRTPLASGTFPKEAVRCRTAAGVEHTLFCKYEAPRDAAFGHRGGIAYEARVYADVLDPSGSPAPRLRAAGGTPSTGAWLVLDFLDGAVRLSEAWREMPKATAWLADFHRSAASGDLAAAAAAFATRYDRSYYVRWAQRSRQFAEDQGLGGPWLGRLCDHFIDTVDVLLAAEVTVIHGEFTVHNVMVSDGVIHPTDWETAAIAPGEIDLMCLLDRWDDATVETCVEIYAAQRWPDQPPVDLAARLLTAELYLHFRWLGESRELMLGRKRIWRFDRLERLARQLGLAP